MRVPAGARQWRARGGPRILSGRKAWGPFVPAGGIVRSRAVALSESLGRGGSVQRGCLPGPGRGWSGRAGQLSQQDGRVGGHPGWSWYPLLGRSESPGRGMDRAAPAPAGAWRCRAGGRHGVACRYWRLGIAESVRRVPPPGRGLPARGVGRGSWCGEVLPRAPRPQVPKPPRCSPGAANRTCTLIARVGMWGESRCSGVSNPIRIPERRAAGWVWGRPPPTCAGSSRWVPSLEGLGLAKTARCLPRHVVRLIARRHVLRGSCWRLNPG